MAMMKVLAVGVVVAMGCVGVQAQQGSVTSGGGVVDLPTSKQLMVPAPGDPRKVNSLPLSLAVSPDGKWVVSLNAGYGVAESNYMQSLAVLNTATGELKDYPDARVGERAKQSFFSGLAFSADGTKVYASLGSTSDPVGGKEGRIGNGVVVYGFANGVLTPQGFFKLPLVKLAAGRKTELPVAGGEGKLGIPYPAAIAVIGPPCSAKGGCEDSIPRLLVAENLSDSVVEMDATNGQIVKNFDLSESDAVPGTYPVGLAVTKDGKRAFVALWNASEVVELDLVKGTVGRHLALLKPKVATAPGTHPCAMVLDEKDGMLYVALANRDAVAGVEIGKGELAVKGYFDTRLPGQSYFGAEPDGLALSADGKRLYAANMGSDAVAVLETRKLKSMEKAKGLVEPMGFVPTELMPLALATSGGKLYVSTDKGKGTGPNNMPQRPLATDKDGKHGKSTFTYAPTLLYGSLAVLDEAGIAAGLKESTEVVLESNRMKAGEEQIPFDAEVVRNADPSAALRDEKQEKLRDEKQINGDEKQKVGPIRHVIYIIKENRTYDQIFGDLAKDGKPVGNGDASLTMYGEAVTPNQHKLALQFGVLDNFYDSAEVSGDGHVWSNAAIGTDYLERTWQSNYRGGQRTYDFEGMVADGYPLRQNIADVEEPQSGYIWGDMVAHGRTTYNFGEYISTVFCGEKRGTAVADPKQGTTNGAEKACPTDAIKPGEAIPAEWGGGKNLWPWAIPRIADNIATKPELVGHFAVESPDFNLRVPDQIRTEVFLKHLEQWKADRAAGKDTMPNFVEMRLGNDHTAGTTPGGPTPKSSVADNDLAIGRLVDAISHSDYWNDTAFFILEDDAQNGADHVDAHRSLGIVVSKYAPHPKDGQAAVVDSRFYSTVSFLRTMELLLGVPPMNNNDALSSVPGELFSGPGDQPAFSADYANETNGLIYTANAKNAVGAAASQKMDFKHPDHADTDKLNVILWQDAMGSKPVPAMLLVKHPKRKDDDN
jgi:DNA-binding beta-propeller fold protein YncE